MVGDTGSGTEDQHKVAKAMLATIQRHKDMKAVCIVGDNIYEDGVTSVTDPQFQSKFEEPYADIDLPFYLCLGNHDYGNAHFSDGRYKHQIAYSTVSPKWNMPSRYYKKSLGPCDLFFLDTNLVFMDPSEISHQMKTMRHLYRKSKNPWKILCGHHTWRSTGGHGNAEDAFETFLQELCQACRFDMYVCGHDHCQNHSVVTLPNGHQMHNVVIGTGGKRYDDGPVFKENIHKAGDTKLHHASTRLGYTVVNANPKKLTISFHEEDTKGTHTATLTKNLRKSKMKEKGKTQKRRKSRTRERTRRRDRTRNRTMRLKTRARTRIRKRTQRAQKRRMKGGGRPPPPSLLGVEGGIKDYVLSMNSEWTPETLKQELMIAALCINSDGTPISSFRADNPLLKGTCFMFCLFIYGILEITNSNKGEGHATHHKYSRILSLNIKNILDQGGCNMWLEGALPQEGIKPKQIFQRLAGYGGHSLAVITGAIAAALAVPTLSPALAVTIGALISGAGYVGEVHAASRDAGADIATVRYRKTLQQVNQSNLQELLRGKDTDIITLLETGKIQIIDKFYELFTEINQ